MTSSSFPVIRLRLAQLAAHLVVALIALTVVGGATRVMEAGLACPDWPLCFGSFLPGRQMNLRVFLEWFHRLDAFVVGIAFVAQFFLAMSWKSILPKWLPFFYALLLLLVAMQAGVGALTVKRLLSTEVVTTHLGLALSLVALTSALARRLFSFNVVAAPFWWRFLSGSSLLAVFAQCLLGGRMATSWASQKCLSHGEGCRWLDLHRGSALVVASLILVFVLTSIFIDGWSRTQWPYLSIVFLLLICQICFGILSVRLGLAYPLITVAHQLIASLLVAFLAALTVSRPQSPVPRFKAMTQEFCFENCNG